MWASDYLHIHTHTRTHTYTISKSVGNQSGSVDGKGVSLFSTALEVIPGHPIAIALQSVLLSPGHQHPQDVLMIR